MARSIEQAVERSKREILADVAAGIVPVTCSSYSGLHDYVDANGYGGAFENGLILTDGNSNIAECHADTDYWNAVQGAVDRWIKAGGLKAVSRG